MRAASVLHPQSHGQLLHPQSHRQYETTSPEPSLSPTSSGTGGSRHRVSSASATRRRRENPEPRLGVPKAGSLKRRPMVKVR